MPDTYPPLSQLSLMDRIRSGLSNLGQLNRGPVTTSTGVTITPEDINRAMGLGMAFSGGGLGIKAYRSSPHIFEKFDLSKIGSGEGAQAYGHGIYAAENPAVSGQGGEYWNSFLHRFSPAERAAAERLQAHGFDREAAARSAARDVRDRELMHEEEPTSYSQQMLEQRRQEKAILESGQPVGPRTYELNINADPQSLLNWDQPIGTEMADKIRQTVPNVPLYERAANPNLTGEASYRALRSAVGKPGASKLL